MGTDGQTTEQVAAVLNNYPGHAFCDPCLAQKAKLDVSLVRDASVALARSTEFQRERWFCSFCLEVKDVSHVPWLDPPVPALSSEPRDLLQHLRFQA